MSIHKDRVPHGSSSNKQCETLGQSPWIEDVTTAQDFEQLLIESRDEQLVLVDVWAPWCAPCQALMPILKALVTEKQGEVKLLKVNADDHAELTQKLGVRSLPTVLIYREGNKVDEFFGALPKKAILDRLEPHLT